MKISELKNITTQCKDEDVYITDSDGGYRIIDWDKVNTIEDFKTLLRHVVNPSGKVYTSGLDVEKFEHLLKDENTDKKAQSIL